MKKLSLIVLLGMMMVLIASCAVGEKENTEEKNNEQDIEDKKEVDTEFGNQIIEYEKRGTIEEKKSGDVELDITDINVGKLEVNDEYKSDFDNKEEVTLVTIGMKAENKGKDKVSFYADQAVLTTNKGEQAEANLMVSEDVGGEFKEKDKKEGKVYYEVESKPEEIEKITLDVNGVSNKEFESLGEDITVEIELD